MSTTKKEDREFGHYTLPNEVFDKLAEDLTNDINTELDSLIKIANEGLRAEYLLLQRFCGKVEWSLTPEKAKPFWYTLERNPHSDYYTYRKKAGIK